MGARAHTRQALPIVPVRVKSKNSDKFVTNYAFLESGSIATCCTTEIDREPHLEGRKEKNHVELNKYASARN